jgi:hypothetical protein
MSTPISQKQQVAEIIKCGKDPAYFIRKYVKIQHPLKGLIPFEMYPYQDTCLEDFEKHRFNIVLKSRQLGLSTLGAAYALWLAIFYREKNILVIATKLSTAINFIKKVKVALAALPQWLKIPKEVGIAKSEVSFDNGSQIKAVPTAEDAGRSEALSLLIVDEAAFIRDFGEIWTGLFPTLSTGGRALIISTPNGVAGVGAQYYRMWTEGEAGQNDFNTVRLEWTIHPEHDKKWYDDQCRQLGDPKRIAQELLCDFLSSGDTYLQPEDLSWVRSQIRDPISREGPSHNVWIWHRPNPAHKYIISADVARGDGADYSTFHIYDFEGCEMVAEFMGKLPPDRFAELLETWGHTYNDALIAPEVNTYGYMTCVKLRDDGYPKLFYKKNKGDPFNYIPKQDELPGFDNQQKSRTQILSKLEEMIRNKQLWIHSRRLYEQLNTFVWNNGKAMASSDSHDDLVISSAIGAWLCGDGGKVSETELQMMYAMLNASKVESSGRGSKLEDIDRIKPLTSANMSAYNSANIGKPRDPTAVQRNSSRNVANELSDFNWLLR